MSPVYMLDTDTVSYALRGEGRVGARLLECRPSEVCISSITLAELHYGAERRRSRRLRTLIGTFAGAVPVVPFDDDAAVRFGVLAAQLAGAGLPIGQMDTLIAAHAMATGCTLVSNNRRHFQRVKGLKTESWV